MGRHVNRKSSGGIYNGLWSINRLPGREGRKEVFRQRNDLPQGCGVGGEEGVVLVMATRKLRQQQRERSLQRKLRRCIERVGENPGNCGVPEGKDKTRGDK